MGRRAVSLAVLVPLLLGADQPPVLPTVDAPLVTGASQPKDYAVVIGIEDYSALPDVPYAARDAAAFEQFALRSRGIPSSRVVPLIGRQSRAQIRKAVTDAGTATGPGGTVWVYFAGHGAASPASGEQMLLPAETPQDELGFADLGLPLSEIERLATAGGGQVMLVIDACFTGAMRGGGQLLGDGKRLAVPVSTRPPERGARWLAVADHQAAAPLPAAEHGAFTYAVLGALRGWADGEVDGVRDGKVTSDEAAAYVRGALLRLGLTDQQAQWKGQAVTLVTGRNLEPRPELPRVTAPRDEGRAEDDGRPGRSLVRVRFVMPGRTLILGPRIDEPGPVIGPYDEVVLEGGRILGWTSFGPRGRPLASHTVDWLDQGGYHVARRTPLEPGVTTTLRFDGRDRFDVVEGARVGAICFHPFEADRWLSEYWRSCQPGTSVATFDPQGRPVSLRAVDASGAPTDGGGAVAAQRLTYDARSHVVKVEDTTVAGEPLTTVALVRDPTGRVERKEETYHPSAKAAYGLLGVRRTAYLWGPEGQLERETIWGENDGPASPPFVTTYRHDARGCLTSESWSEPSCDASEVRYVRDALCRPVEETRYDRRGDLVDDACWDGTEAARVVTTWDASGAVSSRTCWTAAGKKLDCL